MSRRLLIGVIVTDCHVDFQGEILRGIISQAFRTNCDVAVIAPLSNFSVDSVHKNSEKAIFDFILSDRFDGFIYDRNIFYSDDIKKHIDDLCTRSGKPVMLLDSGEHRSFESTSADDCDAFETITDHLIDVHGLKKIYCLTGPKKNYSAEERLRGYMNSMKKHGLHVDKSCYSYGDYWTEASKHYAEKIASGMIERPEAIVCGNDVSAITVTKTLAAAGIRVPEDIAVTGYDASMDGYHCSPSITSYSRPNFQLGAESFRRLYRMITGRICRKVPNENGALRLGRSCGCSEDPKLRHDIRRRIHITQNSETGLLHGDMLFDITTAASPESFADRLDRYTYFIYKMSHIQICLTKNFIDSANGQYSDKLTLHCGDEMRTVLAKSAVQRHSDREITFSSSDILPAFGEERSYPAAYFISPLHYNDNLFGYSAISFGKEPLSFSSLYLQWINYVNIALEHVRLKSAMDRMVSNSVRVLLYDHVTGLLNKKGIEQTFAEKLDESRKKYSEVQCISMEMTGLKAIYYQHGEERAKQIFASAARALRDNLREDEIVGSWNSVTLAVVTFEKNRGKEIFSHMSMCMKKSQFSETPSFNIDFALGQYTAKLSDDFSVSDAIHKSLVNKTMLYTISENAANPQFEKLCLLRSQIMKNPEMPWNIGEIAESLYLSKSYLQKIYKSHFNKSIIEEMIEFRIDKAKKLLEETDLTVTEISHECGYSSYNYFVRQFRIGVGVSPSEYREKSGHSLK